MSDDQRGAYTPTHDVPLEFDPRSPAARRPLPVALIASAALLLALVAAVVLVYSRGVRGDNDPPRPVGEPVAQIKSAPAAGAQPQDVGGDVDVASPQTGQATASTRAPSFAPAPEAPKARAASPPDDRLKVVVAQGPAVAARLPPPPPPPPASAYPSTRADAPAASPGVIAAAPAAASAPSAPRPAPSTALAAVPPAKSPAGPARVQIGAFSSAALADKGWGDVVALLPGLAHGKGKTVETVEKDGHRLFRASITGFADRRSAEGFCDALKAKGRICLVRN